MSIKKLEELKNAFTTFNSGIVNSVCNEIMKEEYQDRNPIVWFYNTRNNKRCEVSIVDKEIKIGKESLMEKYGSEFILYLWIECNDRKINFFYKDVDTNTLNFHVIPGVIQSFRKTGNDEGEEISSPIMKYEDNVTLKLENTPIQTRYLPFSEKIGDIIWTPEIKEDNAINKLPKVKDYENACKKLREALKAIRSDANIVLKQIEGVNSSLRGGLGVEPKYGFIEWINADLEGKPISFDLMYIFYDCSAGLFTAYDMGNITAASKKCDRKETNVLNKRSDEDNSLVSIVYDIKSDGKSVRSTNTSFLLERIYDVSNNIQTFLNRI